jgi:hypothetical protein
MPGSESEPDYASEFLYTGQVPKAAGEVLGNRLALGTASEPKPPVELVSFSPTGEEVVTVIEDANFDRTMAMLAERPTRRISPPNAKPRRLVTVFRMASMRS